MRPTRSATKPWLIPWLVLAWLPANAGSAAANEALRPPLAEMAKQIRDLLKGRGEDAIFVGAFTGTVGKARAPASAGPGIKQVLVEELQKLGVRVKNDANLEIKGDYRDVQDDDSERVALRLQASVLNRAGDAVVVLGKKLVLDAEIEDRDALVQVLGVSKPDFGAGLTAEKECAEIRARLNRPSVSLTGTRIAADAKSPYALEILVKASKGYQARKPAEETGLAYVPLGRDEVFAVRLLNDSEHDAAVELTLDGLSVFAFSDNKGYRHVIVPKKGSVLIKGWHRTNSASDEFMITHYAKSAAAERLGNLDQTGTITATFAAAWDPKESPPRDESNKFRDPFNPAVGRGNPVKAVFKEVVRDHGRVRDVVSVRYKKLER